MELMNVKEYLVEGKVCVDVEGAATLLNRAAGTIRNMTHMKKCPPFVRKGGRLYFEKESLEKFKEERGVIEITERRPENES